ncbi:MAG: RnfABCDGE type electron transport complex subunit D [Bacteroidales bacterium]|jgi:electron transport complex protein RnfD|nr:RnfABCDGE type electron transport complex subunit D [Bacteroidales bacterium]
MNNILNVSPSPHQQSSETTRKLMFGVVIALLPALAASVYYFGIGAIIVTLTSVLACVACEFLIQKYILKTKTSISDGSAVVTGLLLAFNVPSNLPVLIIVIGAVISIGVAKMTFGGLGNNPFNPALVGRVFLLISFPVQMTSWPVPSGFKTGYTDAVTGATPLGIISEGVKNGESIAVLMDKVPSHMQLFYGYMGGSMGEVAAAALILGGIFMIWRKIITWHIPVAVLASAALFTGILWMADPATYADPLFHLLTGGMMLGAIFMATDYVTSPMTPKGMIIYGTGIGVITVLIRTWGAYPEGVSFAILIMNAFVPLLNMYIKPRRFGKEVMNG